MRENLAFIVFGLAFALILGFAGGLEMDTLTFGQAILGIAICVAVMFVCYKIWEADNR